MREEMLRMERVTYMNQGITGLDNFSMTIWAGEILGLVPVNNAGMEALFTLLKQNLPLHYGYIYYHEKLINEWSNPKGGTNRISIIRTQSSLAKDLTVADNIFVLRAGFRKWFMQPEVLRRQLLPFMEEIKVDIPADAYVDELSVFEKFVVELLKAVIAGNRLIVLESISTFVSDSELVKLHEILRFYAKRGISFLYITVHFEETRQFCDRTALMEDGHILKYFDTGDSTPENIFLPCVEDYDRWVRMQLDVSEESKGEKAAFEIKSLYHGNLRNLNVRVNAGECVVVQDTDNCALRDFLSLLREEKPRSGQILVGGRAVKNVRDRRIAIIQELPVETMIFQSMSYLDNLCFNMDHRFKKVWFSKGIRKSIVSEYGALLGEDVFYKRIGDLTTRQKYDLVYTRILLQNPGVVFCVQPFKKADVSIRSHIWELLERFLKKGIAVVILAVNLADSLALADRLIRIQDGSVQEIYNKEDFVKLPINTPWLYLYREKYANGKRQ